MSNKPVILCIMDGYGLAPASSGNAISQAKKPHLDAIFKEYPYTTIKASGEAVGLPDGQMGNSEVGHLNIGAGRIVYQSLSLINKAVKDGSFYQNEHYLHAIENCKKNNSSLHIFGLMSNGGVHSHVNHICAMVRMCAMHGLKNVYVHAFMDGRDVDPQAGASFLDIVQKTIDEVKVGHIASISGRYYAMDRDKNFDRIDVAYKMLVSRIRNHFTDYHEYLKSQYETLPTQGKEPSDEFVYPAYNETIDGSIKDNDSIVFMNFRPDRAIQISTLFTNPYFYQNPPKKDDGTLAYKSYVPSPIVNNITYICTMKYADSVKGEIAFTLPKTDNVLGEYLANKGYHQLRIAETEKYAHVTFFFDGTKNYDGVERPELKNCRRVLINSPKVATYDLKPEMSAYEVTDALIKELDKKDLDVVIINYANCDMVGHTAVIPAAIKAVETVDECVGRVFDYTQKNGGVMIITADHGNCEKEIDEHGNPFTAHTTNPVPLCITKKGLKLRDDGKLSNISPTIIDLLGDVPPVEMTEPSLIIK